MRVPHYWRPAGKTTLPASVVSIDTETQPIGDGRIGWRLGCGVAYRREAGRRTRFRSVATADQGELLAWVQGQLSKQRTTWVVGHNLPFDLKVAGFWPLLTGEHFSCSHCAIGAGAFTIRGHWHGCPVVFSDTFNWWRCSLAKIGQEVGLAKLPMPDPEAPERDWLRYCMRDADIAAAAFDAACQFVADHDLGPFQATAPAQAFAALRHNYLTHKVLAHCDWDVLALERQGYFGGICEAAYIGLARDAEYTELDVQAMYPSCCLGDVPTRLAGSSRRLGPAALASLMTQYLAVADVEIETDRETYPVRQGRKVLYPTGCYRTTLPDPELRQALALGHVKAVHHAAWYHKGPALRAYMEAMLKIRRQEEDAKRPAHALLAKQLANSLYGKIGQKAIRWEPWGLPAFERLEVVHGLPPGTFRRLAAAPIRLQQMEQPYILPWAGVTLHCRDYWGFPEVQVDWGETRDSNPAIAAHVTSLARLLLRKYQGIAGQGHWFYSDTDSLWVDHEGYVRLCDAGCVRFGEPGKLSVRRSCSRLRIHGPKDYEAGGQRVVKGAKASAQWLSHDTFTQPQFPGAASLLVDHANPGVLMRLVTKTLRRLVDKCEVGPDGWTRPLRLAKPARQENIPGLDA